MFCGCMANTLVGTDDNTAQAQYNVKIRSQQPNLSIIIQACTVEAEKQIKEDDDVQ